MFTVCTHCHTRFRLTAAALTAAQGAVRCGKCHEVFDAYELLEGADLPPEMPVQTEAGEQEQDAELDVADAPSVEEAPIGDDVALEIGADAAPELDESMEVEDEPITSAPELKAGRRRARKSAPMDDLFADLMGDAPVVPEAASMPVEDAEVAMPAVEIDAISEEPAPMSYAHVDALHLPPKPAPRRPLRAAAWWVGIFLLLMVLVAQWVNLDRDLLAQNPVIGTSLQALYASLGHPLTKHADAADWQVGALNVTSDPDSGGALSITGALTNGAGTVQPWPVLRVVLTDRFGEPLRARDFKPAEYLPAAQLGSPSLAARFRLDVVDPGPDAVGFSLTPCLDAAAGRVCAVGQHD
ncbi:MAG TPA: DUF3426 domain-containing protein [Gammaproteobacteria bacterium]